MIRIAEADAESQSDNDDDDDVIKDFDTVDNAVITRGAPPAIADDITAETGLDRFGIASTVRAIDFSTMDFSLLNKSSI